MIPSNLAHGIKACAKCRAPATSLTAQPRPPEHDGRGMRWRIVCDICKHSSGAHDHVGAAIKDWNGSAAEAIA